MNGEAISTWLSVSLLTPVGHCHPKVVAAAKNNSTN
jgi:hypothetical protein